MPARELEGVKAEGTMEVRYYLHSLFFASPNQRPFPCIISYEKSRSLNIAVQRNIGSFRSASNCVAKMVDSSPVIGYTA